MTDERRIGTIEWSHAGDLTSWTPDPSTGSAPAVIGQIASHPEAPLCRCVTDHIWDGTCWLPMSSQAALDLQQRLQKL